VNAELVRLGYAAAATFPPNVQHAEQFRQLERAARAANAGLWGNSPAAYQVMDSSGQMNLTPPATSSARYSADGSESYSGRAASVSSSGSSSSNGTVYVKGYTRKDGTYVAPHTRSAPGSGGGRRR
jgi:hypothetical protein